MDTDLIYETENKADAGDCHNTRAIYLHKRSFSHDSQIRIDGMSTIQQENGTTKMGKESESAYSANKIKRMRKQKSLEVKTNRS